MTQEKISYIIGDATHPQGEGMKFILHVANNRGGWGAGFVLALSKRWGMPELMYRKWAQERPQELREGLGKIQVIPVEKDIVVINLVGQDGYGSVDPDGKHIPPIRYDAIRLGLEKSQEIIGNHKKPSLHLPRIGAGLAGGEWDKIESIIMETIHVPITVYTLPAHRAGRQGVGRHGVGVASRGKKVWNEG